MGGEERIVNGDTEWLKREEVNNGFVAGMEHDFGDGSSAASEGFRTYKRRKHARSSSEGKGSENGIAYVEASASSSLVEQRHPRNFILAQLYQSLSANEDGLQRRICEAIVPNPEIGCRTVKVSDTHDQGRNKCPQRGVPYGSPYSAKDHMDVVSDGPLNAADHCIITNMCRRALFDIIASENFSLLCKLFTENFKGIKVDSFLDLSMINARMKAGVYESSPMRFVDDIQQVWRKLQEIGAEMISLAKSLAEVSRTSCSKHVRGYVHSAYDEEKNELFSREPDSDAKLARTEACGVNKVCICRCCEEKADGKDCLVCDSCEEMYHVSCIEPAFKEIPPKSWYCASCTANGIGSPHENCVVCDRLNAPRNQVIQDGDGIRPTSETFIKYEGNSNCSTDKLLEYDGKRHLMRPCGVCAVRVQISDKFKSCGHRFCFHKHYHDRCLTPRQLKSYGSRWLCPSCLCRGCLTDKDDDKIVICDTCDHAYHIYCTEPPLKSIPKRSWFCRKCDAGLQEIRRVKEVYGNKLKNKGSKTMTTAYENFGKELNGKGEEDSDGGRGGMDMLLNAANTLNFQENLAAEMQILN